MFTATHRTSVSSDNAIDFVGGLHRPLSLCLCTFPNQVLREVASKHFLSKQARPM
uniref:Uncharacterized protein n=1 Tax=Anguilla anguilla TaxID=7936 RepID=A0A0E9R5B1_ANGAN